VTRRVGPARPRVTDGSSLGPIGPLVAPVLAIVGLLVVAMATLSLLNGEVPFVGRNPGNPSGPGNGPVRTPAPSNVVVVEPEVTFPGSITYAKSGNIWVQSGTDVRQITSGGRDSMPAWSPDGELVYFVRTVRDSTTWPVRGSVRPYEIDYPLIMRIAADGSGEPERIASGRFRSGRNAWFYWLRQPVISPDGTTIAVITDAPNPERTNTILQFMDLETKKITRGNAPEVGVLGHQDPAWRPDGRFVAFVRNGRDGSRGAPRIMRFNMESKRAAYITLPGYVQPAYSPDGRYLAATKTSAFGTDIVILDGARGTELARVTTDGRSWAPVWSPAGDAIAFLSLDGLIVDLRMAILTGPGPTWGVDEITNLTEVSGLDADSRPQWYVPPSELPATPPPTAPPASPSASPS
jgi:Tol biopolymer transport system component